MKSIIQEENEEILKVLEETSKGTPLKEEDTELQKKIRAIDMDVRFLDGAFDRLQREIARVRDFASSINSEIEENVGDRLNDVISEIEYYRKTSNEPVSVEGIQELLGDIDSEDDEDFDESVRRPTRKVLSEGKDEAREIKELSSMLVKLDKKLNGVLKNIKAIEKDAKEFGPEFNEVAETLEAMHEGMSEYGIKHGIGDTSLKAMTVFLKKHTKRR